MIQALEPILAEELISHVAKRSPATSQEGGAATAKPKIILAHGLFRYTGDPRSERADLTAVQRIGYRAFVRVEKKAVVAVDCVTTGETRSYRVHFGTIATSWLRQVRLLRKRKQLVGAKCELGSIL